MKERGMKSVLGECPRFGSVLMLILFLAGVSGKTEATLIAFQTPNGAVEPNDGLPVDARVTFTTAADRITVELENLLADPRSIGQALSGLYFSLDTGQTSASLTTSSAVPRTIDSDGEYTDAAPGGTGWSLSTTASQFHLDVLGARPAHTIIGPPDASGVYANANASITGNKPHDPFLAQRAVFVLDVPGVTAESHVDDVFFSFGTVPGNDVGSDSIPVPEPATVIFLLIAAVGLSAPRRVSAAAKLCTS